MPSLLEMAIVESTADTFHPNLTDTIYIYIHFPYFLTAANKPWPMSRSRNPPAKGQGAARAKQVTSLMPSGERSS